MAADLATDVVVIGADPAGLTAALTARQFGLEVSVVTPADLAAEPREHPQLLWLPVRDYATARQYLDSMLPPTQGPASAPRRHAFLTAAAQLPQWLSAHGTDLIATRIPDHYPELAGGAMRGRVWRIAADKQRPSLAERLAAAANKAQVTLWPNTGVDDLITDGQRVTGVRIRRGGRVVCLLANRAVVLAGPGFGGALDLRRQLLAAPSRVAWSFAAQGQTAAQDSGLALRLARSVGADTARLDAVWATAAAWLPDANGLVGLNFAAPHSFLVDATGRRIVNEAAPAEQLYAAMYARHAARTPAVPAWLIGDARHRKMLPFVKLGRIPRAALKARHVVVADTLPALARQLGMKSTTLDATAARFDGFCASGVDEDFGRGQSAWDRFGAGGRRANPNHNPTLAPLDDPPFHAVQVVPADWGTKGGALTDEHARVLRAGVVVGGLFAVGAAAASMTATATPGPGMATSEGLAFARQIRFE